MNDWQQDVADSRAVIRTQPDGSGPPAWPDRKVLVGARRAPAANGQAWLIWRPGPPVAAPGTGNRHIDLFCHLCPGHALITQLEDLLCGGGMRGSTAMHGDAGPLELLTDRAPMSAQLSTDLAQRRSLAVHVGRRLNVHGDTLTSLRLHAPRLEPWVRPEGLSLACRPV